VKYDFIKSNTQFDTVIACDVMQVSLSGYYDWQSRPLSKRDLENQKVLLMLQKSFKQSHKTYGIIRLQEDMQSQGTYINHKRVARLKRDNGIYPKQFKRFVSTTDSSHDSAVAKNVLNREFDDVKKNQVWVSDITYIATNTGWTYLAVIIDLYSRKIVGWDVDNHMRASLVCNAVQNAIATRGCLPQMFHSDRGVQYVSEKLETILDRKKVTISMSRRGNCWDNAVSESFFGTLKQELVHHEKYENLTKVRTSLFKYIEAFYNRKRLHSTLGYKSPDEYENAS
jgi:transposase InsO family protein